MVSRRVSDGRVAMQWQRWVLLTLCITEFRKGLRHAGDEFAHTCGNVVTNETHAFDAVDTPS